MGRKEKKHACAIGVELAAARKVRGLYGKNQAKGHGTMRIRALTLGLTAMIWLGDAALGSAAGEVNSGKSGSGGDAAQIEIEADRLVSNSTDKYAEFTGNVKALQGGYRLSSDTLRIYYTGDPVALEGKAGGDQEIKKIVASGNVRIEAEDYTAASERAEYDIATRVLTLSGPDSTVTSGKNSIVGARITLYRAEGRVTVDGESGKRVKAVFFPKGGEADFFHDPKGKPKD